MLFKTKGIVLRSIRYGESSLILTILTEQFGVQSYMVNGVRSARKKAGKANILQPSYILDLVVYHRPNKNLQRISSFKLDYIYKNLYSNIVKNSIAIYISELLYRSLSEPEPNAELFSFTKTLLEWMDRQPNKKISNLPIYFTLKTAEILGFGIGGHYTSTTPFLDLQEGEFVPVNSNVYTLGEKQARLTNEFLSIRDWEQLSQIRLGPKMRSELLDCSLSFLKLHISNFRDLRSPEILRSVLR